jgi:uncharacterized protein (TIGR00251 family)
MVGMTVNSTSPVLLAAFYGVEVEDSPISQADDGVIISVWAVPGASSTAVAGLYGDKVKIRIAAPAEGGRANKEAMRLLKELLGSEVSLVKGMTSRHKLFQVAHTDVENAQRKLGLIP